MPKKKAQPEEPSSSANEGTRYCSVPLTSPVRFRPGLAEARVNAILATKQKWANGTVLHYYFFDRADDGHYAVTTSGQRVFVPWRGDKRQCDVVRDGFKAWKDLGIGLVFEEVKTREEAEVRIGFAQGDGSWSYVGKGVLDYGPAKRTMNFGWDLTRDPDTAIHEIGHTLGFEHEHQNPFAGIVWNEEAVYAALAKPPNSWNREKTHFNIIRKITPDEVQGSSWDPDSVMHYPFEAGLIREPGRYATGLTPRGGLSERDKAWVRQFYPPLKESEFGELQPGRSEQLAVQDGGQVNFVIRPAATRKYNLRTFGACDSLIALFEEEDGKPRYMTADDDSGEERNASLAVKLVKGRKYIARVQIRYSDAASPPTVMMW